MADELNGKKVAILVANEGVEQVELTEPRKALEEAGADVTLIALEKGEIQGIEPLRQGRHVPGRRRPSPTSTRRDFDALLLPGGVAQPRPAARRRGRRGVRRARSSTPASRSRRSATRRGRWSRPTSCKGRTLTSWPSLQTDIRNAGGTWVDEEVHVDEGLVTSRKPDDLPAFNAKMVEEFGEGRTRASGRRPAAAA